MNFKKHVLILSAFLMTSGALASELATSAREEDQNPSQIRSCSSYRDFKLAPVGSVCETDKGGQFKRVKHTSQLGIQDLKPNGKVWFDAFATNVNQYEATEVCSAKSGQSLPTKVDFESAESRGFREAFSGDMEYNFFWSSSVHPVDDGHAYGFDGFNGSVAPDNSYRRVIHYSARCVSAAGVIR